MYILPVWNVTPGMRMSEKSDSTTVFVEGMITPIFARKPTTSGMATSYSEKILSRDPLVCVLVVRRLSSVKGKEEPVEHGRELKGY
jgi:hypothetical protein